MNNWKIYLSLVLSMLLITYFNSMLFSEEIYFNTYGGVFSDEAIAKAYAFNQHWSWLGYALVPVIVGLKMVLVAGLMFAVSVLKDSNISFKNFTRPVLLAEIVPVTYIGVRIALLHILSFNTIDEMQKFAPLSIYSLFNSESIALYWVTPLMKLNLFEMAYWLGLAWLLMPVLKTKFIKSLGFVARSYGIGLLLWFAFIAFLILNMS